MLRSIFEARPPHISFAAAWRPTRVTTPMPSARGEACKYDRGETRLHASLPHTGTPAWHAHWNDRLGSEGPGAAGATRRGSDTTDSRSSVQRERGDMQVSEMLMRANGAKSGVAQEDSSMRVGGTERPQRMDKERRSACACSPKEQNTDTTKVTRRMAGGGRATPKYWRGVSRRSSSRWRARGVTLV